MLPPIKEMEIEQRRLREDAELAVLRIYDGSVNHDCPADCLCSDCEIMYDEIEDEQNNK